MRQTRTCDAIFLAILEAPPGFEPGMEVCRFGAVPYLVDSSCFLVSVIENRVSAAVVKDLEGRGHVMRSWARWNYRTGSPTVTFRDPQTGLPCCRGRRASRGGGARSLNPCVYRGSQVISNDRWSRAEKGDSGAMRRRTFLKSAIGAGLAAPAWASQGARSYDAIVIGAGAIGCTTAYYLREEGLSVCLLDKGPAGREASWASAGMIQPSGSSKSESWPARATLLSRKLYDDLEPRLFEETGKRIGYGGDGGLIVAFEEADAAQLETIVRVAGRRRFPGRNF